MRCVLACGCGLNDREAMPAGRSDGKMTWDVVVIGAGAAGLLAAIRAAEGGKRTLLVEKNDRPGVKILMSVGIAAT